MLTKAEIRAVELTVELANVVVGEVIAYGPTRDGDVREFVAQLHGIQHTIMSQAAGRAHPDRFRLLGESTADPNSNPLAEVQK